MRDHAESDFSDLGGVRGKEFRVLPNSLGNCHVSMHQQLSDKIYDSVSACNYWKLC